MNDKPKPDAFEWVNGHLPVLLAFPVIFVLLVVYLVYVIIRCLVSTPKRAGKFLESKGFYDD
jgi:hypothetical protein